MADGKVFTGKTRQGAGLVVSTGILGDFVLPNGASIRAAPRRSATSPPWTPSTPPRRADRVRCAPTAPPGGSTTPGALASACRR
jgi:hypothetical protein